MAMIPRNPENMDAVREMIGPHHVDQAIRQAISACWMSLPQEKKSVANVEAQIRRLVDRALQNMHEDASQFGFSDPGDAKPKS
jgi:hypothetical protein